MLKTYYHDVSLRGDIVRKNLRVEEEGLYTSIYGEKKLYPYNDKLLLFDLEQNKVYRLSDAESARHYFRVTCHGPAGRDGGLVRGLRKGADHRSARRSMTAVARALSRLLPLREGEGRAVGLLFANVFVLLFAYYLIKPVREMLILTAQTAEMRAYAVALQAVALLVVIPLYTAILRRIVPHYHFVPWITVFLAMNLLAFVLCGRAGMDIGVPFFIWLGVFNVLIVAQFWAFAADLFSVESGERLFVPIALGASLGAWAGALAARGLLAALGAYDVMLLAVALLLFTATMTSRARAAVPEASRPVANFASSPERIGGVLGGFRVVLADRYLLLLAAFMFLLNCVNSTGEYLLARQVRDHAALLAAAGAIADPGVWIGRFYGAFFAWVNTLGLLVQLLLVARIFRLIGVGGAALVLPIIAALCYGVIAVVPVFAVIQALKVLENSLNYSLQNTTRHALILPTSEDVKYAGKTTIDTFVWRLGDLVQAGIVAVGATLAVAPAQFALFNVVLAVLWAAVAMRLRLGYLRLAQREAAAPAGATPRAEPLPSK
jgi:AAA family ATP:ADP antiporter